MKNVIALFLVLSSLAFHAQSASADAVQLKGKSLDAWFKSYFQWYHTGSKPRKYVVDGVRYLPLPQPDSIAVDPTHPFPDLAWFGGTVDISVKASQFLLVPVSAWNGESYKDGTPPDDLPSILQDLDVFNGTDVTIKMDGKTVFSGTAAQLSKFHFGPVYFDQPIPYAHPTSYGAIAAIWEEGTGIFYRPHGVGPHTLEIVAITPVLGIAFDNIWNIKVVEK